jgi:hypothetical protein
MFVRSSIPGNAATAKLRDLSHAEKRYVTRRTGRRMNPGGQSPRPPADLIQPGSAYFLLASQWA